MCHSGNLRLYKCFRPFHQKLCHFYSHKQFSLFPFNYDPVLIHWGVFIPYEWLSISIVLK